MANIIILRLLTALTTIIGVVCLVFFLIHLIPGDPVEFMLGESARIADRAAITKALGLDRPISAQFLTYINRLIHFDLGTSIHSREPVAQLLINRIPATIELAVVSFAFSMIIAFPLGILAAVHKDSVWDHTSMLFALLGVSVPNFLMGPLLIMGFSLGLGWFPISGRETGVAVILPAITLGTGMAAIVARMIRSTLLETLNNDYVRTARAKGLGEFRIIVCHALPNAMLPVITLLGLQLGALLAGAVITETVFSWPGIGSLIVESIQKRDYPIVQGCVLVISLTYVTINALTDIMYSFIDPRLRA